MSLRSRATRKQDRPDVPNMRAHSGPARWGPMAIAAETIAAEPIATERFPARREPTISPSGELGSGCALPARSRTGSTMSLQPRRELAQVVYARAAAR